ncbi:MAG: hypothetical protein GY798_05230 [Hyphomicrobiales bacterium]|nr:hypothetical protein [Hyphomicrobiales bacterium]
MHTSRSRSDRTPQRMVKGAVEATNKGRDQGRHRQPGVANDKLINTGKIKGDTLLDKGDDTFDNRDGKAGRVFGQEGKDKYIAGDAKDKFVFTGALDGTTNVDRVKKFESGKDKFVLDQASFGGMATGPLA